MEQPVKIKYTANYFASTPDTRHFDIPILQYSQNEEPIHIRTLAPGGENAPILEIVTDLEAADLRAADVLEGISSTLPKNVAIRDIRDTLMVVHSAILSQMIKDVVGHYPGYCLNYGHHVGDADNHTARI